MSGKSAPNLQLSTFGASMQRDGTIRPEHKSDDSARAGLVHNQQQKTLDEVGANVADIPADAPRSQAPTLRGSKTTITLPSDQNTGSFQDVTDVERKNWIEKCNSVDASVPTTREHDEQFARSNKISYATAVPQHSDFYVANNFSRSCSISSIDSGTWFSGFFDELMEGEDDDCSLENEPDEEENENEILERQWNMFAAYTAMEERGFFMC
ncbi:hypothetical protein RUND412_003159 [Rhizina undulata]